MSTTPILFRLKSGARTVGYDAMLLPMVCEVYLRLASTEVVPVVGRPDPARICTSIIERQNLTVRMRIRRLTRLTNGFGKKWENLWAALCLHFAYYDFCRVHRSLHVTPAIEAGIRIAYGQ